MNKNIMYSLGTLAILIALYFVFTPSAHAQFVPCVWPNRC